MAAEDGRLRALERTGYPDGGMSRREERLHGLLLEALDTVGELESELREAEEFCRGARWLSPHQKEELLGSYREKLKNRMGEAERLRAALEGG